MAASRKKAKRIEYRLTTSSGYSLKGLVLPNAIAFTLGEAAKDYIASFFGVERNLSRPVEITNSPGMSRVNRYIRKNMGYLHKAAKAGDRKGFERTLLRCVRFSNAFLLLSVHRTYRNWYKDLGYWKLYKAICECKRILVRFPAVVQMSSKRTYLAEKGKLRPIDAPTMGWRFASGLITIFLHVWMDGMGFIPHNQFGGLPGRGTGTAWKYLINRRLLNRPHIFEFDLKAYFHNVKQKLMWRTLRARHRTPDCLAAWLRAVTENHVLPVADRITDNAARHKPQLLSSVIYDMPIVSAAALWLDTKIVSFLDSVEDRWGVTDAAKAAGGKPGTPILIRSAGAGVPQGWACSPMLATQALYPLLRHPDARDDLVMYMDDGLVCSKEQTDPWALRTVFDELGSGATISWAKSSFVKKGGAWLRDFTFLGLKYLAAEDTFQANTRKGATVRFPRAELSTEKIDLLNVAVGPSPGAKIAKDLRSTSGYKVANKYDLLDFFIAYMYNNGVIGADVEVDRRLRARRGTFLSAYLSGGMREACDLYTASTNACEAFRCSLSRWGISRSGRSKTRAGKGWHFEASPRRWKPRGHVRTMARHDSGWRASLGKPGRRRPGFEPTRFEDLSPMTHLPRQAYGLPAAAVMRGNKRGG